MPIKQKFKDIKSQPSELQTPDPKPTQKLILIILGLLGFPAALSTYFFKVPLKFWQIIGLFLAYEIFIFIIGFISAAANILRGRWEERIADFIDLKLQSSRYYRQYLQYIFYAHRDFDVKGLSTQGAYSLEMEKVFVELRIVPQLIHKANKSPIPPVEAELYQKSHSIWDYLKSDTYSNLAIVGSPGSGKTTLLKHLALAFAQRKNLDRQVKATVKLPVLLFLRNYVQIIKENPDYQLTQAICDQLLKNTISIPQEWFKNRLINGEVLIMLDGYDEIAKPEDSVRVREWVERQIEIWGKYKNRFIITSRPLAYRNNPLSHVTLLEVQPFNNQQINCFINYWYLANEILSHRKDDPGVTILASQGADDLRKRLQSDPNLLVLAVNPLLLTMIITVHRYRSSLPERKVELYQEICEVFLGKHQAAKGLTSDLTPTQKEFILQSLAYHLMCDKKGEVNLVDLEEIISAPLYRVDPNITTKEFLTMIENSSGLLIERENGIYGFVNLIFQEYLASRYISQQKMENELIGRIEDSWWHNVILLYVAKSDGTSLVDACLMLDNNASALKLAFDITNEALCLKGGTREKLELRIKNYLESKNPELRKMATEIILNRRLEHGFVSLDKEREIDTSPITCAEFQLFLEEVFSQDDNHFPDNWTNYRFPSGQALNPVVGINNEDIDIFCNWLSAREYTQSCYYRRLDLNNKEIAVAVSNFSNSIGFTIVRIRGKETVKFIKPIQISFAERNGFYINKIGVLKLEITNISKETIIQLEDTSQYIIELPENQQKKILLPSNENPQILEYPIFVKESGIIPLQIKVNGKVYNECTLKIFGVEDNPYFYNLPIKNSSNFFGREDELQTCLNNIMGSTGSNIMIIGEQRSGKTSLLYQIICHLEKPYISTLISFSGIERDPIKAIHWLLDQILMDLKDRYGITNLVEQISLKYCTDFKIYLKKIINGLKNINQSYRLILLFDEAQLMNEIDVQFQESLRQAFIESSGDVCVVIACYYSFFRKIQTVSSPLKNIFQYIYLKPLTGDDLTKLITEPANRFGFHYDEEAKRAIELASGGHPYYCQFLCSKSFTEAEKNGNRTISLVNVTHAENQIIESDKEHFKMGYWDIMSNDERNFLKNMIINKKISSKYIATQLKEKYVIREVNGQYILTATLFETWIKQLLQEENIQE